MTSTKFVHKYRKPPVKSAENDEFYLDNSYVQTAAKYKDKVERMYNIDITFDEKTDDGQWINIFGEPVDRRNAKNYITAMCNPQEVKKVQFPTTSCGELIDPQNLEYIERTTNAFIRPLEKMAQFEIAGTELAVTLALSQIEEKVGMSVEADLDNGAENPDPWSPNTSGGKERLSNVLQRALSENSDGICSVDDYRNTRPSIQRVLVTCLHDEQDDIDDELLFGGDSNVKTTSHHPQRTSNLKIFTNEDEDDDSEYQTAEMMDDGVDDRVDDPDPIEGVGNVTDKLEDMAVGESEDDIDHKKALSNEHEYLRKWGISIGFNEKVIGQALSFADENTRPSDFLDLLNAVKDQIQSDQSKPVSKTTQSASNVLVIDDDEDEDVVILETETIEYTSSKESSPLITKVTGQEGSTKPTAGASSGSQPIPAGYFQKLMQDFHQEDDSTDIEELKRRNAERQTLLKQDFDRQQQACSSPQKTGQAQSQTGKKKKKKKNKKQQQQQNAAGQGKTFSCDDSASDNRTFSQDAEQTCVMQPWSSENNCSGPVPGGKLDNDNQGQFQVATRKKNKWNQFQQQQQYQQHTWQDGNTGNQDQQGQAKMPKGAGRGKWGPHQAQDRFSSPEKQIARKPMQVVAPVVTPPTAQVQNPLDSSQLRYIVIDGSNVAMTHGIGKCFSCKGIRICVDYFKQRGHTDVTVFVPNWRNCRPSDTNQIVDQHILQELKDEGVLVFTPSRRIGRKIVTAYDDRFVLELAEAEDAIIVSNDQYRDLMLEKATWKTIIEEKLLMFVFVKDHFMPNQDPLGRDGPMLNEFLRKSAPSMLGQAQGYRYQQQNNYHQRQQQQPTGQPYNYHYQQQQQQQYIQQHHYDQNQAWNVQVQSNFPRSGNNQSQGQTFKQNFPSLNTVYNHSAGTDSTQDQSKAAFSVKNSWNQQKSGQDQPSPIKDRGSRPFKHNERTASETDELLQKLKAVFPDPDQEDTLKKVLANHPREMNPERLSNYCMSVLFGL